MNYRIILLFFLIPICLLTFVDKNFASQHNNIAKDDAEAADYIIVGLGTAGAIIAKMLSDDHKTSVLGFQNGQNLTQDPEIKYSHNAVGTVLSAFFGGPYDTGYTPPQYYANGRELFWADGTPLGGNSSINAGAYCIGTAHIYKRWEEIAGHRWSVKRIYEIYKNLETYNGKTTNPALRGKKGLINVRQAQPNKISEEFTQAISKATGLQPVLDYNDPLTPIGPSLQVQYTQKCKDGNLRVSSATAFLNSNVMTPDGFGIDGRKLRVIFESYVMRIIWDGNKACGVEYMHGGKIKRAFAAKGIIICAGIFSSALLLHSGVGQKKLLKSYNIPIIFDNPNVGQGLADHDLLLLLFSSNPKDHREIDPNNIFNQIAWLPDPLGNQKIRACSLPTMNPLPGLTASLLTLVDTKSRGTITINSCDPLDPPVIDFQILSDKSDLEAYKNLLMVTIKKINENFSDPLYQLIYPDPSILNDSQAVEKFIKENVISSQHFQSHCRMAPLDEGGVVDSKGRVHGVKNLFVADDSIVPYVMDGSPMASAYLIAANIATMIVEDNCKTKNLL